MTAFSASVANCPQYCRADGGAGAGILAIDFVHVDTFLLKRIYALILIVHGTCRVHDMFAVWVRRRAGEDMLSLDRAASNTTSQHYSTCRSP
jgi:hypothetical protein